MKKLVLIIVIIALILVAGAIYFSSQFKGTPPESIPCRNMPVFANELGNYYENVNISNDSCFPRFSFETPPILL